MPEGDTVRRTAHRLDQALAGRVIQRAELRWPTLGAVDLAGQQVIDVTAYGKHLLLHLAGPGRPHTLHSHLRMDGSWRIHATGSRRWPAPTDPAVRAVLAAPEWTAVGVRLGMLDLLPTADEASLIGHLGPDIMAADFPDSGAGEALGRLASKPQRAVGAALLDQTNLAGIGTMYMAEALFVHRTSPWTTVEDLPDGGLADIVGTARRQLLTGATRAIQTTTGETAKGRTSYVHGRSGQPCRRCGSIVRVAMIGEAPTDRTAFWCPTCQPGPTPTDDGRPRRPLGSAPPRPGVNRYRIDRGRP